MRNLIISEKEYSIEYYEDVNLWIGKILFDDYYLPIEINISVDIEFLQPELSNFYHFLTNDFVKNLLKQANSLLLNFISIVPSGISEEITQYNFKLEGINYKGLKQGHIFENETFRYELLFKLYNKKYVECYDIYANYLVDIDNGLIIGIRREQV